jgi:uncharacterized membrane protein YGL010W
MPWFTPSNALREGGAFSAFLLAYVTAFIGVPPIPLCLPGGCVLSPRPEAFLLAAALPFGMAAILGVSFGVLSSALIYEVMNPMGTTLMDAVFALLTFLAACALARHHMVRRPSPEAALTATWIITGLVTLLLGTYASWVKGHDIPGAFVDVVSEALIPLNVVGPVFLAWTLKRRIGWRYGP